MPRNPLRMRQYRAAGFPEFGFERPDRHIFAIGTLIGGVTGQTAAQRIAAARCRLTGFIQTQHAEIGVGQHTVGHRHINLPPLPGTLRFEHGGQNSHHCSQCAAEQIGNLEIGNSRLIASTADLVKYAGVTEVIDVVAGHVFIRAILTVTADRTIGNFRIDRRHRGITDAEFVHHAGAKALNHHIGIAGETQEDLDARWLFQIETKPLLVAVDHPEIGAALAICRQLTGTQSTGVIADLRIFNLDHLGPKIGQMQAGDRPGEQACQVKNANSLQGCRA